jgi:hypothetical protein
MKMIKYNPLTRRMFLKGAGGLFLTVPVMGSLLPRAFAAGSTTQSRYLQILSYHGANPWDWVPRDLATTKVMDGVYVQSLQSMIQKYGKISRTLGTEFNPIAGKLSLLQGLDVLTGDIGEHSGSTPTTASQPAFGGERPAAAAFPYSIDCILEDSAAFYPTRPALGALRIAVETDTLGLDSVSGLGSLRPSPNFRHPLQSGHTDTPEPRWAYAAGNISAAFQSALGGLTGTNTGTNANAASSLLSSSALVEEYKRVANSNKISTDDKHLLNNYMDLLSQLNKSLQSSASNTCQPNVATFNADAVSKSNEALCSAYSRLVVAALACGVTRVASWYLGAHFHVGRNANGALERGIIDGQDWHPHAHALDEGYSTYMDWHGKRVAELLVAMDQWNEADGKTLLDNSLVYYGSFMATGIHTMHSMPVLLAGGAGGKIRTGLHIDYRQRNSANMPYIRPVRYPTFTKTKVKSSDPDVVAEIFIGRPYNHLLTTIATTMGLTPQDYEKFGQKGIGDYDPYTIRFQGNSMQVSPGGSNRADYLKFIDTDEKKRAVLPYLYMG